LTQQAFAVQIWKSAISTEIHRNTPSTTHIYRKGEERDRELGGLTNEKENGWGAKAVHVS